MTDNTNNQQYSGGFSFNNQGTPQPGGAQPTGGTPTPPPAHGAPVPPPPPPAYPAAAHPPAPGAAGMPPAGAAGATPPPPPPPTKDPNYVFAKSMGSFTTTVKLPAHNLNFDESHFVNLLAGSISLTKDEKVKIIESIPKLRQAQVDELIRIFEEERAKFIELSPKHGAQLEKLEAEHMADWRDIELSLKSEKKEQEDAAQADDIRKQLGL